jgi:hypothetical protein
MPNVCSAGAVDTVIQHTATFGNDHDALVLRLCAQHVAPAGAAIQWRRRLALQPVQLMGANNGTGQPNWLRCAKLRRSPIARFYTIFDLERHELTATGRVRKLPARSHGYGGARVTNRLIQVACTCGHVGWTRHKDAERLLAQLDRPQRRAGNDYEIPRS